MPDPIDPQSQFLTPQQAVGMDMGMQKNAYERMLAQAKALRGLPQQEHSTGQGGLFAALAQGVNAYKASGREADAAKLQQQMMEQDRADRQAAIAGAGTSPDIESLMSGDQGTFQERAQAAANALRGNQQAAVRAQLSGNPAIQKYGADQEARVQHQQDTLNAVPAGREKLQQLTEANAPVTPAVIEYGKAQYGMDVTGLNMRQAKDLLNIGEKGLAASSSASAREKLLGLKATEVGINPVTGLSYRKHGGAGGGGAPRAPAGAPGAAPGQPTEPPAPVAGSKQAKAYEAQLKAIVDDLDPAKGRTGGFGKDYQVYQAADKLDRLTDHGRNLNLTVRQMPELSSAVANLISGGSSAAQSQIEHLTPHTLLGNAAGIAEWITNQPTGAQQQAFVKNMMDTAHREAEGASSRIRDVQLQRLPAHAAALQSQKKQAMALMRGYLKGMSPEEIEAAVGGTYSPGATPAPNTGGAGLKAGEVRMLDAKGVPHAVPAGQVDEAVKHGWRKG